MDEDLSRERSPALTTDRMFQLILGRLDSFPVERLVKMEAELQQLRSVLEEESLSRKGLGQDLQRMAREFGDTMDRRIDRAFTDCRQDRDLRLTNITDRISTIQTHDRESRSFDAKMKVAVFSAISAFALSIINAVIHIVVR